MAPQDKKWDDSAERDLCVAIILGNQDPGKSRHNWPRIAEIMGSLGYSFTKDAMSQHFSKTIMRDFRARHDSAAALESPPLSAQKAKAAGKAIITPSKKRTKKSTRGKDQLTDMDDDEDDDLDLEPTPSKRPKKENDKGARVKKENIAVQSASASNNEVAFRAWSAQSSSPAESHPFY
ncbi:hypothetical protein Trco_000246 [Trichoderma cornu-damae]|uniref:Myb-like domain-containing protein n=1 Tax=Trichoderma cornu-damae TaxID=654480 RepID=A0A9P8QPX5_9HYPO|nr:hypothetical protein Trco_000246 [Trichoderma cornu-damae]